jgi:toxin ParE1/3/4
MPEIRRRPKAREDVLAHFVYIGQDNPSAAERFLAAVERGYARVLDFPGLGAPVLYQSPSLQGVRKWAVPDFRNYLIFYREQDYGIEVLRVLHGARDLEDILLENDSESADAD